MSSGRSAGSSRPRSGHLALGRVRAPPSEPRSSSSDSVRTIEFVHNDAAFIPFSHGPMNCVGKGLAMQQMRTVVYALVQRFRMGPRLEDGWDPRSYEEGFKDCVVANRPELPVVLEPRW